MIDPQSEQGYGKLYRAVERSRWLLEPFRLHRLEFLRNYVGAHYSATGSDERVPLNVLQLAVLIYLRQLAPRAPRAMCNSRVAQVKPVAADMQAWMELASEGMRLDETFRLWVLNAMFGLGVVKVAEAPVSQVQLHDSTIAYIGQPFMEVVDFDDFVFDALAKRFDQCSFVGNRYRVRLSEVQGNPLFNPEAAQKVQPMYRYQYNESGDERPSTLQAGFFHPTQDELEDYCELWDVFLPTEQVIVTFPYQDHITGGSGGAPLRVQKWTGPREGPYHILSFGEVPDNIMPVAPASMWMDLHELANRIMNKLAEQSDRQKTVTGYQGTAADDARRVQQADDGDMLMMNFPDKVKEFRFGGVDKDQMLWLQQVWQMFSRQAGNLDSLGGLAAQTSTFHGDELLREQGSAQLDELKSRFILAARRAYKALAFHWWSNPATRYETTRQEAGVDIPVDITPEMRKIPFDKLDITIDPYSLTPDTPEQRGNKLMTFCQNFLLPLQGALAQAGIVVKWPELIKLFSQYLNIPELADILQMGPPPDQQGPLQQSQQAAGDDKPPMPPVTTRTHVRRNVPMQTQGGHDKLMEQLMGGGGTNAQKMNGMVGRPQ